MLEFHYQPSKNLNWTSICAGSFWRILLEKIWANSLSLSFWMNRQQFFKNQLRWCFLQTSLPWQAKNKTRSKGLFWCLCGVLQAISLSWAEQLSPSILFLARPTSLLHLSTDSFLNKLVTIHQSNAWTARALALSVTRQLTPRWISLERVFKSLIFNQCLSIWRHLKDQSSIVLRDLKWWWEILLSGKDILSLKEAQWSWMQLLMRFALSNIFKVAGQIRLRAPLLLKLRIQKECLSGNSLASTQIRSSPPTS